MLKSYTHKCDLSAGMRDYSHSKQNHFFLSRAENPKFVETLRDLESSPVCQSLAMHSFLMLPMQRVTRLPLLVEAIYKRLQLADRSEEECETCKLALDTINKVRREVT